ncbi:hypothetical protein Pmar_PMAR001783 [Perkinsus marinus ATCC 50983]|uniref:Uncharacterized protein n=1 Tax=Perkinsus marinus (strain ATCC 50983 / TXsc) TaxID=423536 RepID=C5LJM2_PERM5|nr:hypothetical protein Pmar_PMAR001783 [Perkinsus marinus ATCC 50983]EER03039.1 hypothetical protein Pmar_PMAR001783 [Perkinsus marinus ATCC 50983]|eukprot:XP_002771223.1 hypothetical protein Pmar_PMAR001783 [Perkinsus marinus ATCC 50983]
MARFTQSAAMMLAVLSVSLALQSAKPRTRVETKVQALEATVGGLKDQVASLNDQVSALSVHTPEVRRHPCFRLTLYKHLT